MFGVQIQTLVLIEGRAVLVDVDGVKDLPSAFWLGY